MTSIGPKRILSRLHGAPAFTAEWQSVMMAAYTEEILDVFSRYVVGWMVAPECSG